ncbi:MAG: hypothetical protein II887_06355 [Bacteroidales bacterium]|nr:hypothetical protein [Bacteroidales bacterium]
MRNSVRYILAALFLIGSVLFFGYIFSELKKEEAVSMEVFEKPNEIKNKKYEEYSNKEFSSLPHDVQYSLKFPNDVDTIITVYYGWMDTLYTEDGTPLKIKKTSRTCNLVLGKDAMKLYYPYMAKPTLSFSSSEKLYDKRIRDFSNDFSFEFKYDKKKKYYYILRTELPQGVTFEHDLSSLNKPSISNLSPTEKKYKKMVKELYSYDFIYSFSESRYYEYGSWACEENEITKLENWLNSK